MTHRLRDAVAARELKPCDTAEFARLIQQLNVRQVNGLAPLDWAVYRKGPLAAWIRRSLECPARPLSIRKAAQIASLRSARLMFSLVCAR